ncbi:MAG: helix-turn-helix transcriptional regulator [Verrucomicrobiota bacterium]|nr:helix-turn-helix transcriptional regulator [Verrucomicrobiota bacterium]
MGRKTAYRPIIPDSIGNRLTELANKFGGLTDLAKEANVSNSALTRCLNGGAPSVSTARSICKAAKVSLDWFLTGLDSDVSSRNLDGFHIPLVAAEASAGPGLIPPENEGAGQFLYFPSGSVSFQNASCHLFAIHAKGDSMEPTIRNGSLLIANRADVQPREGIYVVRRGDSLLVKRTQPRENNRLRLKSDNEQYDDEEIDLKHPDNGVRILGRVLWIGHLI